MESRVSDRHPMAPPVDVLVTDIPWSGQAPDRDPVEAAAAYRERHLAN